MSNRNTAPTAKKSAQEQGKTRLQQQSGSTKKTSARLWSMGSEFHFAVVSSRCAATATPSLVLRPLGPLEPPTAPCALEDCLAR